MPTRVLSISSSRADVGILTRVWHCLAERAGLDLWILLTGSHVADEGPARAAIPKDATVRVAGADIAGDAAAAAGAMAAIAEATGRACAELRPDVVLIACDRLDMIPAAVATLPFNLPLVHLHGGELAQGAIDDRIRHALSKLAHLHCAATVEAAERLNQMGEEAWRIHVTGAPGLDTLAGEQAISRAAFAKELGLSDTQGLRLVTVHPETNAADPIAPLDAVLAALERQPAPTLLTAPNSDPGGAEIERRVRAFAERHPWAVYRHTLGARYYASALRHAAFMLGNSSSGIVEAALFGLPVIDVGDRQQGRARGRNVNDCRSDADEIARLMTVLDGRRYPPEEVSLYGDGQAAPRIATILADLQPDRRLLVKRFATQAASFEPMWKTMSREAV